MRGLYFGWFIVAAALLVYMTIIGTTMTAFGLFVIPVSAEFNLSRADTNTALILLNMGMAALAPFVGRLLDRFPARRIMAVAALLFGASFIALGLSRSLLVSSLVLAVPMAVAFLGGGTLTMSVLLARWFVAQRGRAMALASMGMSLGGVVVTPLIGLLIEREGWRNTLVMVGGVITVILLALAAAIRERPGPNDVEPGAAGLQAAAALQSAAPAKVGALISRPQFWSIGLGAAIVFGIGQTLGISIAPLGLGEGLTMMQATSLLSVMGGAAMAGAFLLSLIADRLDRVVLLSVLFVLGSLLNLAFWFAEGYALLLVCSGALGLSTGAQAPIFYALLADRFGLASFGTVRGLMTPLITLISAGVVRFAGEIYDRTGGYDAMFATFVAAQLVAAALMFTTRFTKPTAKVAAAPLKAT